MPSLPEDKQHPFSASSVEEPLLGGPPSYREHPSPSPSPISRQLEYSEAEEATPYPVKSRRRRSGRCWTIAFLVVMLPALGFAGMSFYNHADFKDGWVGAMPFLSEDQGPFPTNIGYAGPTVTGKEPGLLATAPFAPQVTAQPPLVADTIGKPKHNFNLLQSWGHLSPYYSVESHGLPKAESVEPKGCTIEGLHWLNRHGARYPTTDTIEGPLGLSLRLKNAEFTASGDLDFLNDWEYKLGAEILTPFGRQQLFNLGVAARVKYGFLLDRMEGRLPVFRTESQDRMLKSAQNFAAGFFGIPAEEQYNLEVQIESPGFNCTLSPYAMCPNDGGALSKNVWEKVHAWENVFLKDAVSRLKGHLDGYELTVRDAKDFMEMCAYETVAIGYSAFCDLFTENEWKGFQYRYDIMWWYQSSFGSPIARAEGIGYAQELISALTHTRLTEFDSTTNSTWHNDVYFPLNDPVNIAFTHDTVIQNVVATLNFTSFAASGPPPLDHIPKHRSFISSQISPFAANIQFQVLSCPSDSYEIPADGEEDAKSSDEYIRVILNDGVVPLTGVRGCPEDQDGKCPMGTFITSIKEIIADTDFAKECGAAGPRINFEAETITGSPVWMAGEEAGEAEEVAAEEAEEVAEMEAEVEGEV